MKFNPPHGCRMRASGIPCGNVADLPLAGKVPAEFKVDTAGGGKPSVLVKFQVGMPVFCLPCESQMSPPVFLKDARNDQFSGLLRGGVQAPEQPQSAVRETVEINVRSGFAELSCRKKEMPGFFLLIPAVGTNMERGCLAC